jgi:P pilus assembly chaperone PapD
MFETTLLRKLLFAGLFIKKHIPAGRRQCATRRGFLLHEMSLRRIGLGKYTLLTALFLMAMALRVGAGVLVAPTVVFISDKGRTGRMTVQNPTDKPQEVTVFFSFGLPTSDSLGNVTVRLNDSAVTDTNSALGWVKAFPRKMVLQPNTSQVVRFRATPPRDLPEGEYWSRVVVRSQDGETSLPEPTEEGAITTKLNMIMQTAIMLKYRKGDLTPQLEFSETSATLEGEIVSVMISMKSNSNCSYVGTLATRLLDANNKEISHASVQLAVYRELTRRLELPLTEGSFTRPYRVEIGITTSGRKDIPAEDILPGNDLTRALAVQ